MVRVLTSSLVDRRLYPWRGHIVMIPSRPVFALSAYMRSNKYQVESHKFDPTTDITYGLPDSK
jgi:hypothetical protein